MNPSYVRHTHALTIFHAIRTNPGITQRELVSAAGTDKSTTSEILKRFSEANLVEKAEKPSTNRPGRPSTGFQISRNGGLLVGVHLRSRELRIVAAGLDGQPISTLMRQRAKGQDELVQDIENGVLAAALAVGRTMKEVRAVGVSAPGLVPLGDADLQEPLLIGTDISLRGLFRKNIGAPLFVDNDANGAALAESFFAKRRLPANFIYVEGEPATAGRGVGGAIFIDDSLHRGSAGYAGEIGHMKIERNGRKCACGHRGCLSTYVEEAGMLSRMTELGSPTESIEEFIVKLKQGSEHALQAVREIGDHLGFAFGNLADLLNPSEIILGGSFIRIFDYLKPHVELAMRDCVLPSLLDKCRITPSTTASDSEPLGGIAIALHGCTSDSDAGIAPWQVQGDAGEIGAETRGDSSRTAA